MTLLLPTGKEPNTPASLLSLERVISNPCWPGKPWNRGCPEVSGLWLRRLERELRERCHRNFFPCYWQLVLESWERRRGKQGKQERALDNPLAQFLKPSHATFQAGRAGRVAE